MKYTLVHTTALNEPYWWEDRGTAWGNRVGGFCTKSEHDKVIETVEADCFEDLDWFRTGLYRPDSDTGWLSPWGQFIGCHYREHDDVANLVLGQKVGDMERRGWVRVVGLGAFLGCYRHPTDAQRDWARHRGYKWADDDHGD